MNYYSTGEVAQKLEISVRTIRYYDQIDLLKPSLKKDNGKRFYNDHDILTLEKITILKTLNLSLEDIKKVMTEVTIEQILTANRRLLKEKMTDLEKSVLHTNTLLNILKIEEELDWEQLIPLVRKDKEEKQNSWDTYFTEEEQEMVKAKLPKMERDDKQIKKWINLIKRIEICLEREIDSSSEEAQILAEDTIILTDEIFGGNRELEEKFWNVRKSPKGSEALNLYPIRDEVMQFLEESIQYFENNSPETKRP
ncbi:MerR family transcriptional regulator [Psychrobacillus sp. FSL H8-0484]|uniref:MerR family transcriptional regulator n=1 Tax=Psychrobacillus sp. FSL H8-0484 TaxID=2921390 RepID=UPI0030F7E8BE